MVPPDRIRRELTRAVKAGATEYLLDNTSDVRPVVMTTRALMELAWNAKPWMEQADAASAFLTRWSREEFGEKAAAAVADLYRAYFDAPGRYGEREDEVLADNAYHTLARDLALRAMKEKKSVRVAPERLAVICREADVRWSSLDQKARRILPSIPADRCDFFRGHILTQIDVHLHSNRMLLCAANAALAAGNATSVEHWRSAAHELELQQETLHGAEYGKWAGFYQGEQFVGYTVDLLRWVIDRLEKRTGDAPPARPDGYVIIKAYQGSQRVKM
jgi:hypothetical protein